MLFYQIHAELNELNDKYNDLETAVMDNYKVCEENTQGEESLNHRIYILEQEVQDLKEQNNELRQQHNRMVTEINSVIIELNNVITVINNKHEENYYFYVYFVKKSLIVGFLRGVFKKVRSFEKGPEF